MPAARDAAVNTHAVAPIDVELSTAGESAASARDSALAGLDALAQPGHAADPFRLHNRSYAQRQLSDVEAPSQLLTVLTDVAEHADGGTRGSGRDAAGAGVLHRLNMSLGALVDFNVNENWISVADVLEYEITEFLPQRAAVIRAGVETYSIS
jgi:hypothetical protein